MVILSMNTPVAGVTPALISVMFPHIPPFVVDVILPTRRCSGCGDMRSSPADPLGPWQPPHCCEKIATWQPVSVPPPDPPPPVTPGSSEPAHPITITDSSSPHAMDKVPIHLQVARPCTRASGND